MVKILNGKVGQAVGVEMAIVIACVLYLIDLKGNE